jgi:hypothetical protein
MGELGPTVSVYFTSIPVVSTYFSATPSVNVHLNLTGPDVNVYIPYFSAIDSSTDSYTDDDSYTDADSYI